MGNNPSGEGSAPDEIGQSMDAKVSSPKGPQKNGEEKNDSLEHSAAELNVSGVSCIEPTSPGYHVPSVDQDVSMRSLPEEDEDDQQKELDGAVSINTTVSPRMKSKTTPNVSASTSFDERFKYKISIYSKVSGCRMTNLPDYTIVKQVRVVSLQYVTNGDPHAVLNIKFAYEKMKNGGLQIITDDKRLSNALSGLSYFATIPCKVSQ